MSVPTTIPQRPAQLAGSFTNPNYRVELGRRFVGQPALIQMESAWMPSNQQRKPYAVVERTALICIDGCLSMDPWYWDETGYGEIQAEVKFATEDADVDRSLLVINSPGGSTDGAYETADMIRKMGKVKPIYAVAAPCAYSAAYLLASQTERIWAANISGGVGSIGVYCVHFDFSKAMAEAGIVPTIIEAGEGKTEGNPWEPLSKAAKARLQAEIDRLYKEFVARVARGRSASESEIIKLGAHCYDGATAAIAAGLADRTGSPDDALAALAKDAERSKLNPLAAAGAKGGLMKDPNSPAAEAPAPTAPPVAAPAAPSVAAADPVNVAKEISSLCQLAGRQDLLTKFIDGAYTVDKAKAELLNLRAEGKSAGGANSPGELSNGIDGLSGFADQKTPKGTQAERMRSKLKAMGITPASEGRV
jgi:signal peptide peptidase SppA